MMNLKKAVIHRKGAKNAKVRKENQQLDIFLIAHTTHPNGE
jgi:hypothetical protein